MIDVFAVIGNDEKSKSCAMKLNELGYKAKCFFDDNITDIPDYKYIILPLPTVVNGKINHTSLSIDELNSILTDKNIVFCGNVSPTKLSCQAYSYFYDADFTLKNSRLTAQGTLKIILDNIKLDLTKIKIAVIGYGNCGKAISETLASLGGNVTVFSRKTDCRIRTKSTNMINALAGEYDVIINTVPFEIINENGLSLIKNDSLYIEIASKPFGFSPEKAVNYGFKYIPASGLPGKFTPISAGFIIAETVDRIIKEEIYD